MTIKEINFNKLIKNIVKNQLYLNVFPFLIKMNRHGTVFIPAYLVDELVISSEFVALQDEFGFQKLREKNIQQDKLMAVGLKK